MKILFICMNPLTFNSSGNLRNIGCLKGFLELGHSIDVITLESDVGSINYDNSNRIKLDISRQYNLKQNPLYKRLRTKKSQSVRGNTKVFVSVAGMFSKAIRYLINTFMVFDPQVINVQNIKLDSTYNLVVSSSDPKSSHVLARYIIKKNKLKCPWYQYWGDPMYDDITISGGKLKRYRLKCAEKNFCHRQIRLFIHLH